MSDLLELLKLFAIVFGGIVGVLLFRVLIWGFWRLIIGSFVSVFSRRPAKPAPRAATTRY